MIFAKQIFADELVKAMPIYGTNDYLRGFVYCNEISTVGGAYLTLDYPHKLVMEFYAYCPTIINAIAESFKAFFNLKNLLIAEISASNVKSLKIARQLGFKVVRKEHGIVHVQLSKEHWRYFKRVKI